MVRTFDGGARTPCVPARDLPVSGNPCVQTSNILFAAPTNGFAPDFRSDDAPGSITTLRFATPSGTDVRTYTRVGGETRPRVTFAGLGGATGVSVLAKDIAGLGRGDIATDAADT